MERPRLHVLIVGAGLSGLTCAIVLAKNGIRATVLEKSNSMLPAGNGIQLPPNASRVMAKLGLFGSLLSHGATITDAADFFDYKDDRTLFTRDLGSFDEKFGTPWMQIHRHDYYMALLEEARTVGVNIRLGADVQDVNFGDTSVTLATGENLRADVIVGADGIHSAIRKAMLPAGPHLEMSGHVAYRQLFTREQLQAFKDPGIQSILDNPSQRCRFWLGPNAHVVLYALRNNEVYNLVVIIQDDALSGVNSARNADDDSFAVKSFFLEWNSTVRAFIGDGKGLAKFQLFQLETLPTWVKGNFVLMGDAAHPTLPFLAQGAAIAVESAISLATTLVMHRDFCGHMNISRKGLLKRLPVVLDMYEKLRKPRTSTVVEASRCTGDFNHAVPGSSRQIRRDQAFEDARKDQWNNTGDFAWANMFYSMLTYKHDAEGEAIQGALRTMRGRYLEPDPIVRDEERVLLRL